MKRYIWKRKERALGEWFYRILRIYRPKENDYQYCLQRSEKGLFARPWETIHRTLEQNMASDWSDELGLIINEKPDRVRKPVI